MLRLTKYGIYCPEGDFYIDATGKVERNIVTHAHSDHARPGHISYLSHHQSVPLLKRRLGKNISIQSLEYRRELSINGVRISLHPSGHIYGAAQVKVSQKGRTWVVSGDYKVEDDALSTPFEPVKCDVFVTECTFGLPVYHWPDQDEVYLQINNWWRQNLANGTTSLLFGYSLGKSQRIIQNIDHTIGPVYVHRTVGAMNEAIKQAGGGLPDTRTIDEHVSIEQLRGNLIIAPPSIRTGSLLNGIGPISTAMASGWVQSGRNTGGSADYGFILSDHVDWDGLMQAISDTGAQKVVTMHGYTSEVTRWLNENGLESVELADLQHRPFRLP